MHLVGFIIRLPDKIDKSGHYYIRIQVFTEENDHIFQYGQQVVAFICIFKTDATKATTHLPHSTLALNS